MYTVSPASSSNRRRLSFGNGALDWSKIRPGNRLWKTSDPELNRELQRSYRTPEQRRTLEVAAIVQGTLGQKLSVSFTDGRGRVATEFSKSSLTAAQSRPLDNELLRDKLGRLGGSTFHLTELNSELQGSLFLPVNELNEIRRRLISKLESAVPRRIPWALSLEDGIRLLENRDLTEENQPEFQPQLSVLVRTMAQLEAVLRDKVSTVYCDFENVKRYRDAVNLVATVQAADRPQIFVAPPRIFKTGEEFILKSTAASGADGFLIRNYDQLEYFRGSRMIGDFSLNIANHLTAKYLKKFGLERLTVSYDLNILEVEALLNASPATWYEATIHQHMPMFHMEHCVFCAFLTKGKDYRDCGRPCDTVELQLRDHLGREYPVKADAGCRNTVFNSHAQTGAEAVKRFMELGLRNFRIDFVNEPLEVVKLVVSTYLALLKGESSGSDVWRSLKVKNQLGVTRGQLPIVN